MKRKGKIHPPDKSGGLLPPLTPEFQIKGNLAHGKSYLTVDGAILTKLKDATAGEPGILRKLIRWRKV